MPGIGTDSSSSFEQTQSTDTTTPRDPGGGVLTGILNDIFNIPSRLESGKFIAGEGRSFRPIETAEEAINLGLLDKSVFQGPELLFYPGEFEPISDKKTQEILDSLNADRLRVFNEKNPTPSTGRFTDQGFGSILELLTQGNPLAGDSRGLIDQAIGRQGDLFRLSADSLSDLISGDGQPVDTRALAASGFTDLKEQFAGLGGLFSSDLQSEQLRLGTELNVAAQESARQRQLQGQLQALGLAQGLGQSQLGFSRNLLGLGSEFNRTETAAGRELGFLRQLSQLQSGNLQSEGADRFAQSSSEKTTESSGVNFGL